MKQVQFTKDILIEKFNLCLGCTATHDIKPQLWHNTQTTPALPRKLTSHTTIPKLIIKNIADAKLKNELEDLGHILKTTQKLFQASIHALSCKS